MSCSAGEQRKKDLAAREAREREARKGEARQGSPGAPVEPPPRLWRNFDELSNTPAFRKRLGDEFPAFASEWIDEPSRRNFLKLMAASLALAGVYGCTAKPREEIIPYVMPPEQMVPGKPLYFATATNWMGYARGTIVQSHEGRPTKIEGNPDHPASLGATDAITQADVLNLYDPDRSQLVTSTGQASNWNSFIQAIELQLQSPQSAGGKGLRLLTETITSPTLADQIRTLLKKYPQAKWHQYEPVSADNQREGARLATGQALQPVYRFDRAKVILSLDDDFLYVHPGSIAYARQFTDGRRVRSARREMNRLYVIEATPSITGTMADHRLRIRPSRIGLVAQALHAAVSAQTQANPASTRPSAAALEKDEARFVEQVSSDLKSNPGAGLVVVGQSQSPEIHALAHAINSQLGNIGKTVQFINSPEAEPVNQMQSLRALVSDMTAGAVQTLIILGGNPVYTAPADFNFAGAMKKVPFRVHLSLQNDETSFLCHWHLPMSHSLETWSDLRAFDGTISIVQPLIAPLYQSRSAHELLAILAGDPVQDGYTIIRNYWQAHHGAGDYDPWWTQTLSAGVVKGTASPVKNVTISTTNPASAGQAREGDPGAPGEPNPTGARLGGSPAVPATSGFEIVFRPDPQVWDGRYANNGWLLEMPRPLTKLSWDNAALMSAATAKKIGVLDVTAQPSNAPNASVVEIRVGDRSVRAPAWIMPGQPDDVITLHLGFGRTRAGRSGTGAGFNAYPVRTSSAMHFATGAEAKKTNEIVALACTQTHNMMDPHGRDPIHVFPISAKLPAGEPGSGIGPQTGQGASVPVGAEIPSGELNPERRKHSLSLYPEYKYADTPAEGNKWGMVIDQNACIGCNACIAACVAENNIPIVGKDQVARGREMFWLRVDSYYEGAADHPGGPYFQPLPCMHCETAPCELVCPVGATVHDVEGLNNMVYNRCIGTRYCSNNCPYKVRHFNFLHYTDYLQPGNPESLQMNPNVTIRYRGVMEKCSYCVQRISAGRINAKREFANGQRPDEAIRDGEVKTACQQVCPTEAIFFGNLNDQNAEVRKVALEPGNYGLLDDLQTRPRTTYLPRYVNPPLTPAQDEGAFF
jgi:molybdopterin-containing oxidoreductase family iron-sulfur binding subunit